MTWEVTIQRVKHPNQDPRMVVNSNHGREIDRGTEDIDDILSIRYYTVP